VKLERKINERDAVIFDLQNDIKAIASQLENAEEQKKMGLQVMAGESLDIRVEPSQDKGVIRIEMSSEQIQTALNSAGYYDGPIDGKIGPQTLSAIYEFQKDHDLKIDGIVGKETGAQLKQYLK